ncbi:hypothetical protein N5D48_03990 [Pseudomonas sp. GD03858]|uniref:hypothetical protein n=1 Tax=unclassified Pseudomonas TaxID=196821 RepID=UPI002448105B|nr:MULTISPECIES: hypothetical protein [unclassified Pseudomonas]MDH0646821.1 hypothetical protein [Pseudomonas sp. GD03867]MDH0661551.1 hypothetical protein [Pseudomonas sp. GD03858]
MFKSHQIWKRIDDQTAVIYYCFEDLGNGRYCVQNAEFVRLPIDDSGMAAKRRTMELFIEECPSERSDWADTLAAAVTLHDAEFGN